MKTAQNKESMLKKTKDTILIDLFGKQKIYNEVMSSVCAGMSEICKGLEEAERMKIKEVEKLRELWCQKNSVKKFYKLYARMKIDPQGEKLNNNI